MSPSEVVNLILDSVGYCGGKLLSNTILEPSFGTGNFLVEIVSRIISFCKCEGFEKDIPKKIKSCVFGIEKDKEMYDIAIERLNALLVSENVPEIDWNDNLICGDALMVYEAYKGKFDFVVGNPPYISIHHIPVDYRDNLKNFRFSDGTSDLYIIFYEMGIQMLNEWGKLGFITPNTFLRNVSQKNFRNYLISNNLISGVFDFKTSKLFSTADTYTCICLLDKEVSENVLYREYSMYDVVVENELERTYFNTTFIDRAWDLSSRDDMLFMEDNKSCVTKLGDICCVQNAVQTSIDTVFIFDVFEDEQLSVKYMGKHTDASKVVYFKDKSGVVRSIESDILRRCIKESRYNGVITNTYIIFPYLCSYYGVSPMSEDKLSVDYPMAYAYFCDYKDGLASRDIDSNLSWFLYARSQGLQNINRKKVVFKHMILKGISSVDAYILDEDVVVYAGMYISVEDGVYPLEKICKIISSGDFAKYCSMVGKDMSGGYVTVSCKNVKQFGLKCI